MTFTDNETYTMAKVLLDCASQDGEDLIGLLLKHGCTRYLPGEALVHLTTKLEAAFQEGYQHSQPN